MIDANENLVAEYRYDPFGRTTYSSGSLADANVYRFSSKAQHAKTGYYYYGYRFYDPHLQKWLNRDPIGERGGINLYGFVLNNPMGLIDLLGLDIYVTPGIHPRIIGDRPGGGCYSIEFTIPPGAVYRIWNPGHFGFGEWSLLPPSAVAGLRKCRRIPTCPSTDKALYDMASRLGQNQNTPRYNLLNRNCRTFANEFCAIVGDLNNFGTPYDPGHSRRNAPPMKIP